MARNETEEEAIAKIHGLADGIFEALFLTCLAAMTESKKDKAQARQAFHGAVDKIIEFALEDD
jgi:hypothetical protein